MGQRVDSASRVVEASAAALWHAFAKQDAMEHWLPPRGMTAKMAHFDFREGGSYRVKLMYAEGGQGLGKTSEDADEVEAHFTRLVKEERIEQSITFESEDPSFAGIMRMEWTFEPMDGGTLVRIRAMDVPRGIRPEDHEAGLSSTLENLASFVESKRSTAARLDA